MDQKEININFKKERRFHYPIGLKHKTYFQI